MESLKNRTRGCDIFSAVEHAFDSNNINWENLIGVTTNRAMMGHKQGFKHFLKNKLKDSNNINKLHHYHCIIHQENLIAQVLKMNNVMNDVIKTVNFIKKHALNHRQFKTLLKESESPFGDVIYIFSEVRWLLRGQTLKRFFSLKKKLQSF